VLERPRSPPASNRCGPSPRRAGTRMSLLTPPTRRVSRRGGTGTIINGAGRGERGASAEVELRRCCRVRRGHVPPAPSDVRPAAQGRTRGGPHPPVRTTRSSSQNGAPGPQPAPEAEAENRGRNRPSTPPWGDRTITDRQRDHRMPRHVASPAGPTPPIAHHLGLGKRTPLPGSGTARVTCPAAGWCPVQQKITKCGNRTAK